MERVIYHEKQSAALCGEHALNNLLQGPYFSSEVLADIAREFDQRERELMLQEGSMTSDALRFLAEGSGNVDDGGNFSIQVLNEAVRGSHGVHLESVDRADMRHIMQNPTEEQGFVCNHSSHWLTLRRLATGDRGVLQWFNLNSTLPRPQPVSDFFLSAFLAQLTAEGYSIFVARGTLPTPMQDTSLGRPDAWHRMSDGAEPRTAQAAAGDPWSDAGAGFRLGGEAAAGEAAPAMGGEDDDLQRAIAASMAGGSGGGGGVDETEEVFARYTAMALPEEPAPGVPAAEVAHVRLRLPDGSQLKRRFRRGEQAALMWKLLPSQEAARHVTFRVGGGARTLDLLGCAVTGDSFESCGLAPSASLFASGGAGTPS